MVAHSTYGIFQEDVLLNRFLELKTNSIILGIDFYITYNLNKFSSKSINIVRRNGSYRKRETWERKSN